MLLVPLLALFAGALTTVAGMGGGLVLLLGLSLVFDPLTALATTGPALLVGNLHRARMYRASIVAPVAWRFALGAVPGALIGGWIAVGLPEVVLRALLVGVALFAGIKVLVGLRWTPPPATLIPGGALAGFVTATSGGGGMVAAPLLLATGLSGRRYVATGAAGAAAVHVSRMAAYGAGGIVDSSILVWGLVAAVSIALGNLAGDRIRDAVPVAVVPRLEVGMVACALTLSLLGIA